MPPAKLRRSRNALMALFFNSGMIYASWGVQIPLVKARFALDAAELALALLALSIGSIAVLAALGHLFARMSGQRACTWSGLAIAAATSGILLMPSYPLLCGFLLLFGALNAALDVTINAEASALETLGKHPIMSSLHAMFSVGGFAGASFGGVLLAHHIPPEVHMMIVSLIALLTILLARRSLSTTPTATAHSETLVSDDRAKNAAGTAAENTFSIPSEMATAAALATSPNTSATKTASRHLWALGGVALIALIAEGAMYDWSAVYMRDVVHASLAFSSSAYGTFSGGMAAGRFCGDWVRARTGNAALLKVSGLMASAGMIAALLIPTPTGALLGFTLMGLGLANMIPVLFAAAGRVSGYAPAHGIARVAGMAYTGMMAGPVLIGLISQGSSLSIGLSVVALAAAGVGIVGARVLTNAPRAM